MCGFLINFLTILNHFHLFLIFYNTLNHFERRNSPKTHKFWWVFFFMRQEFQRINFHVDLFMHFTVYTVFMHFYTNLYIFMVFMILCGNKKKCITFLKFSYFSETFLRKRFIFNRFLNFSSREMCEHWKDFKERKKGNRKWIRKVHHLMT